VVGSSNKKNKSAQDVYLIFIWLVVFGVHMEVMLPFTRQHLSSNECF